MSVTPKTGITEMADGQTSPYATFNEALRILEVHAAAGIVSRTTAAEPSLVDGAAYILPASPTGTNWASFSQHDLVIAFGGVWNQFTPVEGWDFWINDDGERAGFDGASWAVAAAGSASTTSAARVAGSTYSTVQHMQDVFHSSGTTSGGGFTDDTDGTMTVAVGTGLIRATDSDVAELLFTDWAAEAGANVALTDNDLNYIYVEYNAGSPQVIATITKRTDYHTNILLGTIYRLGTTLHMTPESRIHVSDHAGAMIRRMNEIAPFARVSGSALSETGTRNIAITAGSFWQGLEKYTLAAKDTSVADDFTAYYSDGASGFTAVAAQTQIDNTQYDDGSGTLATLASAKYGVHWVFQGVDEDFYVVYGLSSYSLSAAETAAIPASLPPHFEGHVRIVGKIIIQKSASVFTSVESAFDTQFEAGIATDHNDLLNNGSVGHADLDTHFAELETVNADNPHGIPLAKRNATTAPAVSNDNTEGYGVGSEWNDVTNDKAYVCLDASTGAAVWTETTGAGGGAFDHIKLSDVKSSGTDGGTFTQSVWQTRTLNTEDDDDGGHCSLASNQFTLAAGTYVIAAIASAVGCGRHKVKLRNISDSSDELIGTSDVTSTSVTIATESTVTGQFTIASSKIFELQHYCQTTRATNGFGLSCAFGVSEIYAIVELWKTT